MRVIAGSARRLQLKTIDGDGTRPTTDRIKETLFNMINNEIPGSTMLDLYSGSGGIGIEALSRGASKAYFVENNRKAMDCIKDNLNYTKLINQAVILCMDAVDSITRLENDKANIDIVFMDPPYNNEHEKRVLTRLMNSTIIDMNSIIIVEASLDTDFGYVEELGFTIDKEKRYKTNKHMFLSKAKKEG